jgi:glyoxylase-like metal-dependent hydrolase (beta-lactamase superfamily II)
VLLKGVLGNATPRPVGAWQAVEDGQEIRGGFRAIATPGHTAGHVAYYHVASEALFCGDALAVVSGQIRLMARAVTPDRVRARESAAKCFLLPPPKVLCPGHRRPLSGDLGGEWERMRKFVASAAPWPVFG